MESLPSKFTKDEFGNLLLKHISKDYKNSIEDILYFMETIKVIKIKLINGKINNISSTGDFNNT